MYVIIKVRSSYAIMLFPGYFMQYKYKYFSQPCVSIKTLSPFPLAHFYTATIHSLRHHHHHPPNLFLLTGNERKKGEAESMKVCKMYYAIFSHRFSPCYRES